MSATPAPTEAPVIDAPAQHGAVAHSDGDWANRAIPVQTRSERFSSTDPAAFPAVTGREVDWKLSPVPALRPLIDGPLDGSPYAYLARETPGATVEWVSPQHELVGTAGTPEDRASANAWSSVENVLLVTVSGDEPSSITIGRSGLDAAPRAGHTVIHATPNSSGLVILQNSGDAQLVENVEIIVDEGAHLTVVTVQEWNDGGIHLASHLARIGRDAQLKHFVVTLGGSIVRVNPSAHLADQGADADLNGVYFADAGQHLEQQVYVNHDAPSTKSRVNYKGALQGEGARTVWIGDVLIGRTAPGTDSYEQNRNLVLSEGTRADSIPNLEIETGDILGAGHASATGRFDDEHLFYLESRGIPEEEARRIVVLGFLSEIVQHIGEPALEERLIAALEAELADGAQARAEANAAGAPGRKARAPYVDSQPGAAVAVGTDHVTSEPDVAAGVTGEGTSPGGTH
ncbi:iron-regulated ABC transporter permease protein SufD [Frondihabitans sp. PhB188]|uniref:Fe-S cluster assembly protein SufD n=1 Tax=Frondihabitans sp. PhB188 TaxID=2485200 RepID=UPI000F46204B|nr:Fe-S cluster assembly protein SufD [Frondihabitans sp. PhB188]ROQ40980.1 iron-regulated ABC transporter permease protein SufD [Frondihabitans sp. PhB188]